MRALRGPDLWILAKNFPFGVLSRYNRKAHRSDPACNGLYNLGGLFLITFNQTRSACCVRQRRLCVIFASSRDHKSRVLRRLFCGAFPGRRIPLCRIRSTATVTALTTRIFTQRRSGCIRLPHGITATGLCHHAGLCGRSAHQEGQTSPPATRTSRPAIRLPAEASYSTHPGTLTDRAAPERRDVVDH